MNCDLSFFFIILSFELSGLVALPVNVAKTSVSESSSEPELWIPNIRDVVSFANLGLSQTNPSEELADLSGTSEVPTALGSELFPGPSDVTDQPRIPTAKPPRAPNATTEPSKLLIEAGHDKDHEYSVFMTTSEVTVSSLNLEPYSERNGSTEATNLFVESGNDNDQEYSAFMTTLGEASTTVPSLESKDDPEGDRSTVTSDMRVEAGNDNDHEYSAFMTPMASLVEVSSVVPFLALNDDTTEEGNTEVRNTLIEAGNDNDHEYSVFMTPMASHEVSTAVPFLTSVVDTAQEGTTEVGNTLIEAGNDNDHEYSVFMTPLVSLEESTTVPLLTLKEDGTEKEPRTLVPESMESEHSEGSTAFPFLSYEDKSDETTEENISLTPAAGLSEVESTSVPFLNYEDAYDQVQEEIVTMSPTPDRSDGSETTTSVAFLSYEYYYDEAQGDSVTAQSEDSEATTAVPFLSDDDTVSPTSSESSTIVANPHSEFGTEFSPNTMIPSNTDVPTSVPFLALEDDSRPPETETNPMVATTPTWGNAIDFLEELLSVDVETNTIADTTPSEEGTTALPQSQGHSGSAIIDPSVHDPERVTLPNEGEIVGEFSVGMIDKPSTQDDANPGLETQNLVPKPPKFPCRDDNSSITFYQTPDFVSGPGEQAAIFTSAASRLGVNGLTFESVTVQGTCCWETFRRIAYTGKLIRICPGKYRARDINENTWRIQSLRPVDHFAQNNIFRL